MKGFRRLTERELATLDDDALIAYALRARETGDDGTADLALQVFAFGMEDALRSFVRNRLDAHGDAVIDEIAEQALEDAVRSILTLRGSTAAEGRAFVFRIARLRIIDYLRGKRLDTTPIDAVAEGPGGRGPGMRGYEGGLRHEGDTGHVDASIVLSEALADLRPDHRFVVEHYVLRGYSAREVAEMSNRRLEADIDDSMTEQNVHQIGSRFRKDLRARLGGAEEG